VPCRIRDIGELYLRILFCTYIFTPVKGAFYPVKSPEKGHSTDRMNKPE
jgi:hypothetical protein